MVGSRICQDFSDGSECLKPAVTSILHCWYCAEHYDGLMAYYRRTAEGDAHNSAFARRILKENL